jgi:replicative DNA helicase
VVDDYYDRALQHPPVGCAWIREHFPKLACKSCPRGAPYHGAKQPILDLVKGSPEPMERPTFKDALQRIKGRRAGQIPPGIQWGVAGLDQVTRLRNKELTVVGALPSIGKTHLMTDAAVTLAEAGVAVFAFSAETGRAALEERLLARRAKIDSRALRNERTDDAARPLTDQELARVEQAGRDLAALPLYVHYTACDPDHILALVEETLLAHKIPLDAPYVVFMDYLQFAATDDSGKQTEYAMVSKIVKQFKYMAKILDHPVVLFSQVRRDNEGEEEPSINWFKSSGRIEADADVALILTGQRTPGAFSKRKLTVVKQREGEPGGVLHALLHQAYGYFEPLDGPAKRDAAPKDLFAHRPDAAV